MSKELLCIHCGEEIDEFAANPSKWNAEHLYHWGCVQRVADEFAKGFAEWLRESDRFNSGQSMDMVITEYKATL